MSRSLRAWVLHALRVPSEPSPPPGSREPLIFRASPRFYQYRLLVWGLGQLVGLLSVAAFTVAISFLLREVDGVVAILLVLADILVWTIFLAQVVFSFAIVRLDFELRWYILSDRSLRIREGILSLREKTMTFANIQQITIRQNPLQRILRIADVRVTTAGGGGGGKSEGDIGEGMHEASFRGVDNAEAIRSLILERVRLHRDSGLGNPDESPAHPHRAGDEALAAARSVHFELRSLNRAIRLSGTRGPAE